MKRQIRNILITAGADTVLAGLLFWYESTRPDLAGRYIRILSDAFFVPGMITLCLGLLVLVSNGDGFYAVGYLFKKIGQKFSRRAKDMPDYYEYVQEKKSGQKAPIANFFIVAAVFIAAGALFAVIHG